MLRKHYNWKDIQMIQILQPIDQSRLDMDNGMVPNVDPYLWCRHWVTINSHNLHCSEDEEYNVMILHVFLIENTKLNIKSTLSFTYNNTPEESIKSIYPKQKGWKRAHLVTTFYYISDKIQSKSTEPVKITFR